MSGKPFLVLSRASSPGNKNGLHLLARLYPILLAPLQTILRLYELQLLKSVNTVDVDFRFPSAINRWTSAQDVLVRRKQHLNIVSATELSNMCKQKSWTLLQTQYSSKRYGS